MSQSTVRLPGDRSRALRESAYGALIRAHLAEGNRAEAAHQLEVYRRLLADELGLSPSVQLMSLVLATA